MFHSFLPLPIPNISVSSINQSSPTSSSGVILAQPPSPSPSWPQNLATMCWSLHSNPHRERRRETKTLFVCPDSNTFWCQQWGWIRVERRLCLLLEAYGDASCSWWRQQLVHDVAGNVVVGCMREADNVVRRLGRWVLSELVEVDKRLNGAELRPTNQQDCQWWIVVA